MVRADLPKDVGIADEGAEEVDGVGSEHGRRSALAAPIRPRRRSNERAVVGGVEPNHDARVVRHQRAELAHDAREHGGADFGTAPSAAHRSVAQHVKRIAA